MNLVKNLYAVYDSLVKYRQDIELMNHGDQCIFWDDENASFPCDCGLKEIVDSLQVMEDHHAKHGRIF